MTFPAFHDFSFNFYQILVLIFAIKLYGGTRVRINFPKVFFVAVQSEQIPHLKSSVELILDHVMLFSFGNYSIVQ